MSIFYSFVGVLLAFALVVGIAITFLTVADGYLRDSCKGVIVSGQFGYASKCMEFKRPFRLESAADVG